MSRGQGPQRWKRGGYVGKNSKNADPLWHRSKEQYDNSGLNTFVALCGYTFHWTRAMRYGYQISRAIRPKGDLCAKCEKQAEIARPTSN